MSCTFSSFTSCLSPAVKYFYDEALSDTNVEVDIDTIDQDLTINFDQIIERVYSRDEISEAEAVVAFIPLLKNIHERSKCSIERMIVTQYTESVEWTSQADHFFDCFKLHQLDVRTNKCECW